MVVVLPRARISPTAIRGPLSIRCRTPFLHWRNLMRTIVTLFLAVTLAVAIAASPAHTQRASTAGNVDPYYSFPPWFD